MIDSQNAAMRQVEPAAGAHIKMMGFWHTIAIYRQGWARFLSIAAGCIPSYYLSAKFGLAWYWTAPIVVTTALGVPLARAACCIGQQPHPLHWSAAIKIIAILTGASIVWLECGLGWRRCALGSTAFVVVPVLIKIVWKLNDRRHAQIDHPFSARIDQENAGGPGMNGPGKGALGGT